MARQRPLSLLLVGLACSFFAALYLFWLLFVTWAPLAQLLAVAVGDADPLPDLVRVNLATTKTVRAAVLLGSVRAALMIALLATGVGLVLHRRWARRAAIFGGGLVILLALTSTACRLWFLTLPGGAVKVTPLLMDAVAILFANVLCGTMFLPEISAAYAGSLEPVPSAQPDLSAEQPAPV